MLIRCQALAISYVNIMFHACSLKFNSQWLIDFFMFIIIIIIFHNFSNYGSEM